MCAWVSIVLRHAEIDDMNEVGITGTRSADEKVVGFDITSIKVVSLERIKNYTGFAYRYMRFLSWIA